LLCEGGIFDEAHGKIENGELKIENFSDTKHSNITPSFSIVNC